MNLRKRRDLHDEDAMSAMNDIMFFLLLFFLIISTMANPNVIKIVLPKASESEQMAKQPVTLTVTEELKYFINTDEVPADQLEGSLKAAIEKNADPTIVLRVAKTLTVQDLVDVMQIGARLKLKMVMSTEK
jgi:biopolymer transport protein ExbD